MHPDAPFLALLTSDSIPALPRVVHDAWRCQGAPNARDLFEWSPEALAEALGVPEDDLAPLLALRARLPSARALIDRLAAEGVTLVTARERAYPRAARETLGADAPPVLWLAGSRDPLARGPVAIVGERDAPMDALALARETAIALAREGRSVLTGVATAFERAVLQVTLAESGGSAVAVVHYGLARALPNLRLWRQGISEGRLLLLSHTHPEAPWEPRHEEIGGALLAGLADRVVLVGGGAPATADRCARQALRLRRPLFVRTDEEPATAALLAGGAHVLVEPIRVDLVLAALPLNRDQDVDPAAQPVGEAPPEVVEVTPGPARATDGRRAQTRRSSPSKPIAPPSPPETAPPADLLEAALLRHLTGKRRPTGKGALVRALAVEEAALDRVLLALIAQGHVVQRPHRAGVAYGLADPPGAGTGAFQLSIFSQE